jgi:putative oxidoreductase
MSHAISEQSLRTDPCQSNERPTTLVGALPDDGTTVGSFHGYGPLLGRILLAHIFLLSGVGKIMDWEGTAEHMAGRGMFWIPAFLIASISIEHCGSLSLIAGFKTRLGATALFLFLIPVTLVFHNFWTYPEAQQQMQMINFMKNIAIMGGLWMVIGLGPGPISIDAKLNKPSRAPASAVVSGPH